MTNRRAIRRNPLLTALTLLAVAWILLSALRLFNSMQYVQAYNGYIGHTAVSGWIGLVVLAAAVGLLLLVYSELPEDGPLPQRFPPER